MCFASVVVNEIYTNVNYVNNNINFDDYYDQFVSQSLSKYLFIEDKAAPYYLKTSKGNVKII